MIYSLEMFLHHRLKRQICEEADAWCHRTAMRSWLLDPWPPDHGTRAKRRGDTWPMCACLCHYRCGVLYVCAACAVKAGN